MTNALPVGILLAAGRGRRFDPAGIHNKLLQPLAGSDPVAMASARALLAVLPRVVAVVACDDDGVADALRAAGCEITVCPDAGRGMAASLVHGLRACAPACTPSGAAAAGSDVASARASWIVALGDMPFVKPATIAALAAALADGAQIAAPVYGGQRGNPVGFGPLHLPALLALRGDHGARAILSNHPVTLVSVDDPGILRDIDLPADLPHTDAFSTSSRAPS